MAFKMKGSAFYGKSNQSNYGKPSMAKDYDVNKGSHGHPHEAPLKEHAEGHVTKDGKTTAINVVEGRDNKKGQSQKDVVDSRNKNQKTYVDNVKNFSEKKGGLTEAQIKAAEEKIARLNALTTSSMDSIQGVNIKLDAEDAKKKTEAEKEKAKQKKLSDDEFNSL